MEASAVTSPALNTRSRRPVSPDTTDTPLSHAGIRGALPFTLETPTHSSAKHTVPAQPLHIAPLPHSPLISSAAQPTDISTLHGYFTKQTVQVLRKICEHWNLRLAPPKAVYVAQCFLYVLKKIDLGAVMRDVVVSNPYALQFDIYLESGKRSESPPSRREMEAAVDHLKALPQKRRQTPSPPSTGSAAVRDGLVVSGSDRLMDENNDPDPFFCLDEYARLCVLLRDHPRARQALLYSGREMSAAALDARLGRDHFWTSIVEKVFNDTNYKPVLPELTGVVDGVNPAAALLCRRTGDKLKEWFRKLRSDFTEPYDKWGRSGQNCPDRFPDFLICRCGTPNSDTDFMDTASKLMTAADRRGYEEGFGELDDAMAEIPDTISLPSTEGSRKRRKQENTVVGLDTVANAIQNLAPKVDQTMEKFRKQSELMELVGAARSMAINSANNRGLDDDDEYEELAQQHYVMLKEEAKKALDGLRGSQR